SLDTDALADPYVASSRTSTAGQLNSFFFFSSRRRHTRSLRDWSSDVCSSDLSARPTRCESSYATSTLLVLRTDAAIASQSTGERSEERRVGKECRSRGSPYHDKKKSRKKERTVAIHEWWTEVEARADVVSTPT